MEVYSYNLWGLASDVGGFSGLFLGLSLWNVWEKGRAAAAAKWTRSH